MATSSSAASLLTDGLLRDVPVIEGHKVLADVALYARVGQGGMGIVYRGLHCRFEADRAVKVLKPSLAAEDARFAQRFHLEAKVAADISHQNVVRLFEAGEKHGLHYMIMEFIDGESMHGRVARKGRLPEREALGILLGAASGLAEAHRAGTVHRDIKPENVLITRSGRVKIADLGLVKRVGAHGERMTLGAEILGTPQYMAPEQFDTMDVSPAADVWALGATLWFLLVGRDAIAFEGPERTRQRVQQQDFPSLREARPDLRAKVHELFERCMARRATDRFADARALVDALRPLVRGGEDKLADPEAGQHGAPANPPTPPPRATIERIREALTDTNLAGLGIQRSEAETIASNERAEATGDHWFRGNSEKPTIRSKDNTGIPIAETQPVPPPPRRRRRPWLVAGGLAIGMLGIAMSMPGPREWILGWFGLSSQQRAERLFAAGREAQTAGRLDEAIAQYRAAAGLDDIPQLDDRLLAALEARADAALAREAATQANAERAFLDAREAEMKRFLSSARHPKGLVPAGAKEKTELHAAAVRRLERAKQNLDAAVAKAIRIDEPRNGAILEPDQIQDGRIAVRGTIDWPDVSALTIRTPQPLLRLSREVRYECRPSGGVFTTSAWSRHGAGAERLRVEYRSPRGDLEADLPVRVFITGPREQPQWLKDASSAPGTVVNNSAGITMLPIPVRTFTMGSLEVAIEHRDDEVQHEVTITQPFWLGATEVTRAQWMRVMGTSPWLDRLDDSPGDEPAMRITWAMANEFCARLTKLETEKKRVPAGYRYCLPTEAQWELAAHGGTYRTHVHGDNAAELEQFAFFGDKVRFPDPVARRKPNPFGLHDLAGNVDEWCQDSAEVKDGLLTTLTFRKDAVDPICILGSSRVYRGGNASSPAVDCRTAARFAAPPDTARDTLGFRVALARR